MDFRHIKMRLWQYKRSLQRKFKYHSVSSGELEWSVIRGTLTRFFFYGVFSILSGVCIGVATAIFGHGLLFFNALRDAHIYYFLPFLGIAGVIMMSINMRYGGKAQKGMGLVFAVGLNQEDSIPMRMAPMTVVSTWMTHLFGGSAGREGVAIQIGATIAMQFSRLCKIDINKHIILTIGMAAGFAGLFGTPVAATFFALEVLVVGSVYYEALAPALIAAYTAAFTSRALGLHPMFMPIGEVPPMDGKFMAITILGGLLFGAVGWLFSWLLSHLRLYFALLIDDPRLRIFIIGCILAVFLIICDGGRYCGLSTPIFEAALTGGDIYFRDWILKLLFTTVTLAAGFQGGELTPLFVIGTALGAFVALQLGLPVALFAAMGCVAVFGSATKTLLAPIFIGAEVFGTQGLPFYCLVVIIGFLISGHHGIYANQRFLSEKAYCSDDVAK